jgi:hypothetical protein
MLAAAEAKAKAHDAADIDDDTTSNEVCVMCLRQRVLSV